MLLRFGHTVHRWITTLKFKIVVIAVVTAVVSATVTVHLVFDEIGERTRVALLRRDAEDRERTAMLMARRLEVLQVALTAVAARVTPELLADPPALLRYLADKPSINALFGTLFAIGPEGRMIARLQGGEATPELADLSDRPYWKRMRESGLPEVSPVVLGRISGQPEVVFAVPVKSSGGALIGGLGAGLRIHGNQLLSSISHDESLSETRDLVMDQAGHIVAHADPKRLLGEAGEEPGFRRVYDEWVRNGRTLHAEGVSELSDGTLVSMAGVPVVGWMIVRLTPEREALRALNDARVTAWRAALGVGLTAGLIAGLLAWAMTQPISRLRKRAERLLADSELPSDGWPRGHGEVGELSRAFEHVIEQRQNRQRETQALVARLAAVLDNADVGIAFVRDEQFELVSQRFCRIFEWDKARVQGQPVRLVHSSDAAMEDLSKRARVAFAEGVSFEGEVEMVRRSGESFWAHVRGRALEPSQGQRATIWIVEDVTRAREQRERLAWTATHDSLTGLTNRPAFEALLERATERAANEPFCALFIDLDRFKEVNDSAGHAAGDAVLRDLAHRLSAQVRQSDTVARLGGDEFAVLLNRCPTAQALAIAEKLRAAVEAYALQWEGRVLRVGASIGLVPVDAGFGGPSEVIRAADAACYVAKRGGRNRVEVHRG